MASLNELLKILPSIEQGPKVHIDPCELYYVPRPELDYVVPDVVGNPEAREGATTVVLIEAAAAVGKTALARFLARSTGAPVWDLSRLYLGSGSLWGRLAQIFGAEEFSKVIARLVMGNFLLIMDALDEAELRAAGPSFDTFLSDIKDLFQQPRPRPTAVLLARAETAEYISLYLGSDFPLARYQIQFFDRVAVEQFVDQSLDRHASMRGEPGTHRKRRPVFEEGRDRLFAFMMRGLREDKDLHWGSDRVKSFLGYAPVLEALAEYIDAFSDNYQKLAAELDREDALTEPPNTQWDVLVKVVEGLIDRESEKYLRQAKGLLTPLLRGADWTAWESLYSQERQCGLVLERVLGQITDVTIPDDLPESLVQDYRASIRTALPNHPFFGSTSGFANVVFRDYLYAWALAVAPPQVKELVRQAMREETFLPTPLLSRFFLVLAARGRRISAEAQDFGFLYESFTANSRSGARPQLVLVASANGDSMSAVIGSEDVLDDGLFELTDVSSGVQLWRRLSHARIEGSVPIRLGFPGGSFVLGPSVDIRCALLEVPAGTLRVDLRSGSDVTIYAEAGYITSGSEPNIYTYGDGKLTVNWSPIRYPWVQYRGELRLEENFGLLELEVFVHLCRIVGFLRRMTMRSRPVSPPSQSLFSRYVVGGTQTSQELFQYLVEQGIVTTLYRQYVLDVERLEAEGVSTVDTRLRNITPGVESFIRRFLESRRMVD